MIKLGRFLHDKIALNEFAKNAEILKGNVSVAVVDAAAAIATAIIIRAVLMWAEDITLDTFIAIFSAFLISQLMLVILTRLREKRYAKRNQDASMQQALVKKLVLAGINLAEEVEKQHNIGIAAVEMAISIAVALILTALMA